MLTRLRLAVFRVANTVEEELKLLPTLERSLVPLLSASSFLYSCILSVRRNFYQWGILKQVRLSLPVISVGNISWGGNGKTPMVEFIAQKFLACGTPPLILTRGYRGGDEVRLLESHFQGTRAKIGVGSDRVKAARGILCEYGVRDMNISELLSSYRSVDRSIELMEHNDSIGIVLMDDGMQHWKVCRDIDIVMVNAVSLFGNGRLLPRGPLREPLEALSRADIAVIHHANLVSELELIELRRRLHSLLPGSARIFTSAMIPQSLNQIRRKNYNYPGKVRNGQLYTYSVPLTTLQDSSVLCVSGIGCPGSLAGSLRQLGVRHIHRMDYPDHHIFDIRDIMAVKKKLTELETKLKDTPVIISTEKDHARCPDFFGSFEDYNVYILCSVLEIMDDSNAGMADFIALIAMKLERRK